MTEEEMIAIVDKARSDHHNPGGYVRGRGYETPEKMLERLTKANEVEAARQLKYTSHMEIIVGYDTMKNSGKTQFISFSSRQDFWSWYWGEKGKWPTIDSFVVNGKLVDPRGPRGYSVHQPHKMKTIKHELIEEENRIFSF